MIWVLLGVEGSGVYLTPRRTWSLSINDTQYAASICLYLGQNGSQLPPGPRNLRFKLLR